jgi:hypothetical protein
VRVTTDETTIGALAEGVLGDRYEPAFTRPRWPLRQA